MREFLRGHPSILPKQFGSMVGMTTQFGENLLFDADALISWLDHFYPRVVTQIDRDPDSPTYGSCDRHYWMYRLNDFDSGVLQQAGLTFAVLAALAEATDLSRWRYLKNTKRPYWRSLAKAINRRTVNMLGLRGWLDEYYPGECSFPATVFACYATLKAAVMLNQQDVIESPGLEAAALRLLKRSPSDAANQDTACAAFLALYARTRSWNVERTQAVVKRLLGGPDGRGMFIEYGGLDLGYATVSLNYLAYMHADHTYPTDEALKYLASMLADFVTPSGRLGGEFASRSTTYLLPFGMLQAAKLDPILATRFRHLDFGAVLEKLDDRYLMHYCLPSVALASLDLVRSGAPQREHDHRALQNWMITDHRDVGLYACHGDRTAVFIALNKGGALQVEVDGETTIDCGYRVTRNKRVFATCVLDEAQNTSLRKRKDGFEITVEVPFRCYAPLIASPLKTVLLRLFRISGGILNSYFKQRLIKRVEVLPEVKLRRRICVDFLASSLTVDDEVTKLKPGDCLSLSPPASLRLVPSANFYQTGEEDAFLNRDNRGIPAPPCFRRVVSLSVRNQQSGNQL